MDGHREYPAWSALGHGKKIPRFTVEVYEQDDPNVSVGVVRIGDIEIFSERLEGWTSVEDRVRETTESFAERLRDVLTIEP